MANENYINHIGIVVDASYSMSGLARDVVKVVDGQVEYLAQRSKDWDQETRVTEYMFNDVIETKCIHYDKDVLRLPSIGGVYQVNGNTPLIDATIKAINDMSQVPELYGDHAHLMYVVTDGQENRSRTSSSVLRNRIQSLPDNWTVAVLVPDARAEFEAKKFGFLDDNIGIWDTSSVKGLMEVGERIKKATDDFMQARTRGVRSSRGIFQLDTSSLSASSLRSLSKLRAGQYEFVPIYKSEQISAFVESVTGRPYKNGKAFYQISKPETVQAAKDICVVDRADRSVYTGSEARRLLSLPDYEVRVRPSNHPHYDIYIQSTSYNRKLVPGTNLLLLQ
jgi:hypothetical protein